MQVTSSKVISLGIAVAGVCSIVFSKEPSTSELASCLVFALPLVLIWFSEGLGRFTGYVGRGGNVDVPTPSFLVSGLGWLVLIVLAVRAFVFR